MLGWSGLLAVLAANIVVVSYVVMAWREDEDETRDEQNLRKVSLKTD